MKEYANARKDIVNEVLQEIVGPLFGKEEVIDESPLGLYCSGILYPRNEEEEDDNQEQEPDEGKQADTTDETEADDGALNDSAEEEKIELRSTGAENSFFPSACGISFLVNGLNEKLSISTSYAKYRKLELDEIEEKIDTIPEDILRNNLFLEHFSYKNKILKPLKEEAKEAIKALVSNLDKTNEEGKKVINAFFSVRDRIFGGRKRVEVVNAPIIIDKNFSNYYSLNENVRLFVLAKVKQENVLYTLSLINNATGSKSSDSIFQVGFSVESVKKNKPVFLDYTLFQQTNNVEELSLQLLYRNKKSFGVGHGTSIDWDEDKESGLARSVWTTPLPSFEVPDITYELEGSNEDIKQILLMNNLSDCSKLSDREIISCLKSFCDLYKTWIGRIKKETVDKYFEDVATKHISDCNIAYKRMYKGVELLEKNSNLFQAFKLANRAMRLQRMHFEYQKQRKRYNMQLDNVEDYYFKSNLEEPRWRPFQLAFLLLSVNSISSPDSEDRSFVDLIWFPTGGGKTEAYFGLCAFSIFLRMIRNPDKYAGTAIVMRYTLRLLTSQQFQRACTLICACEYIRRENAEQWKVPINIGLWIGGDATPNEVSEAKKSLEKMYDAAKLAKEFSKKGEQRKEKSIKNTFQVLSCPWCGTYMDRDGVFGYTTEKRSRSEAERFKIYCPNKSCTFNEELPIAVIDEDVYNRPPTLLFATVDKFAALVSEGETKNIFALNKGNNNLSPELIIQDELHLISGPLGSMVGIYETAIDVLCSAKNKVPPKIIASTATIRNANEQCFGLYKRTVKQFPPPGLDCDDSFFSRVSKEKNGRQYVGIMPWGKSQSIVEVRLVSKILQAVCCLNHEDRIKDPYWTLVTYFNSIRELGKFDTFVNDDIAKQIENLSKRKTYDYQRYIRLKEELTGRKKGEDIRPILDKLEYEYTSKKEEKNKCLDLLSATSMFSVGVDIQRLSIMMIAGQPKTTSEYIQASSRVGRKYPGLVMVLYNSVKSRDRSHYEKFRQYHQSIYRGVEPTSLTPFAPPTRDRGLAAIFILLVRHLIDGFEKNDSAGNFRSDIKELTDIKDKILDRIKEIDEHEYESSKKQLEKIILQWHSFVSNNTEGKVYFKYKQGPHLISSDVTDVKAKFFVPSSLRSVDVGCKIRQDYEKEPEICQEQAGVIS